MITVLMRYIGHQKKTTVKNVREKKMFEVQSATTGISPVHNSFRFRGR